MDLLPYVSKEELMDPSSLSEEMGLSHHEIMGILHEAKLRFT
jgi:hypothetical protein